MSAPSFGDLGKQRRFLGAADGERRAGGCRFAEFFELGAAELARGRDLRAAAAAAHRASASSGIVSSHEQIKNSPRAIGHLCVPVAAAMATAQIKL